jgi:hypothetical protein
LPATLRAFDAPGESAYRGTFLAGHYAYDDEGVPAQRVDVITDGKLQGMVMSRAPTKHFKQSNGHGRRVGGEAPRAAIGCLFFESANGLSAEDLKQELIDAAEAEGLDYGLRVVALQPRPGGGFGGRGGGRGGFSGGGSGAPRLLGDPITVFKVYIADGREELVRGAEFGTVDVRNLRRILATGTDAVVHNSVSGGAPASSVIAPAVLIEEIELSRIKQEAEKKPILAAPRKEASRQP